MNTINVLNQLISGFSSGTKMPALLDYFTKNSELANYVPTETNFGSFPLTIAFAEGSVESLRMLLVANANVNNIEIFPYLGGISAHRKDIAEKSKLLLEYGLNVNKEFYHGWTLLHIASYYGNIELLDTMLSYKADVNWLDDKKRPPLALSVKFGHYEIVEKLLKSGADPNLVKLEKFDVQQYYHAAVNCDFIETLKLLLRYGLSEEKQQEFSDYFHTHGIIKLRDMFGRKRKFNSINKETFKSRSRRRIQQEPPRQ